MIQRMPFTLFFVLVAVSLLAGCFGGPAPTAPPSATSLPTQPPTDTPTTLPSPTNTLSPTTTPTTAPPTSTPTSQPTSTPSRTPLPVTNTPKPKQSPAPTQAPAAIPPTAPPSAPGVDVVAARGKETCTNKLISVSFPWEQGPDERKMYYWDRNWSVYPTYARPNIKLETATALCNKQNQCRGFTADFCVYIDPSAPLGGTYESVLNLVIFSAFPNGSGRKTLAEVTPRFSWLIK
jgi:hypothetical protein